MEIKDRILIVEDDKSIVNLLVTVLKANHYEVYSASRASEAKSIVSSQCPDVVLLDLGLPDADGMSVIEYVRSYSQMPIIVLSARGHEQDKVRALDLGADDYMVKPFSAPELLARIRTALRHYKPAGTPSVVSDEVTLLNGRLVVSYKKHRVFVEGTDVKLTQNEYRIVALLARFSGRVLTYDYILKEIWGPHMKDDNKILRVNMANIRRKIEKNPARPEFIFTEAGVGYRMTE
ncbi:MAG: response regulator transcription factor [Lachnospiraceae bacterium]|nr:response regulator transcription factor [Lachnospiraceae bacterium]MBQ7506152.1 response regulator transcription factor [Lachnospiraceae bacterium]